MRKKIVFLSPPIVRVRFRSGLLFNQMCCVVLRTWTSEAFSWIAEDLDRRPLDHYCQSATLDRGGGEGLLVEPRELGPVDRCGPGRIAGERR